MLKCLVFIEHKDDEISGTSLRLCTRLQSFPGWSGVQVSAVVFGPCRPQCLNQLAEYGIGQIYHVEGAEINLPETCGQAVLNIVLEQQISLIILPGTFAGRELAPFLAAQLDAGVVADCQELSYRESGRKESHEYCPDGSLEAVVEVYDRQYQLIYQLNGQYNVVLMSDLDPGAVKPAGIEPVPVKTVKTAAITGTPAAEVLETFYLPAAELDIGEADVVVGIGRGIESAEDFGLVQELAAALGAAVAGTRPAVDGGFIPFSRQVGQTGRLIAPRLYIAIGISGAPQHITGVGEAKIVAVNSDPLAPILRLADLGVTGDLREVVPVLTRRIKAIKEGEGRQ